MLEPHDLNPNNKKGRRLSYIGKTIGRSLQGIDDLVGLTLINENDTTCYYEGKLQITRVLKDTSYYAECTKMFDVKLIYKKSNNKVSLKKNKSFKILDDLKKKDIIDPETKFRLNNILVYIEHYFLDKHQKAGKTSDYSLHKDDEIEFILRDEDEIRQYYNGKITTRRILVSDSGNSLCKKTTKFKVGYDKLSDKVVSFYRD